MMSAELFRRLQESYLELETERILRDEKAIGALRAVSSERPDRRYTLAEVEDMVAEDDGR